MKTLIIAVFMFLAVEAKGQIYATMVKIDTTKFEYAEFLWDKNYEPYRYIRLNHRDSSDFVYMLDTESVEPEPGHGALFTWDIETGKKIKPYITRWLERQEALKNKDSIKTTKALRPKE